MASFISFCFIYFSLTMAAERETEKEELLESEEIFRNNAFTIIDKMLEWSNEPSAPTELVDEVLHSIFFLGKINRPPYSPEMIVDDEEMLEELKQSYPRPFNLYSSQLPKRSPFSCVLDMIVHLTGEQNQGEIIEALQELNQQLSRGRKARHLISSTVCVSHNTEVPDSVRYYGVSMSTSGRVPGKIMVAASCLSYWDKYVTDAVMTYYPDNVKKEYFDGTIRLPVMVRCQAITLSGKEIPPCVSCGSLFGLHTVATNKWAYGNCAEVESVSNLFKNEGEIKEEARPTSPTYTAENRQTATQNVLDVLKPLLKMVGFKWEGGRFYDAQTEWYPHWSGREEGEREVINT